MQVEEYLAHINRIMREAKIYGKSGECYGLRKAVYRLLADLGIGDEWQLAEDGYTPQIVRKDAV